MYSTLEGRIIVVWTRIVLSSPAFTLMNPFSLLTTSVGDSPTAKLSSRASVTPVQPTARSIRAPKMTAQRALRRLGIPGLTPTLFALAKEVGSILIVFSPAESVTSA